MQFDFSLFVDELKRVNTRLTWIIALMAAPLVVSLILTLLRLAIRLNSGMPLMLY